MPTATDVLNLARSQLGVAENPLGSNRGTPYHAWYGAESQGWQWCAIFVCWIFWHSDPALIHNLKSAYSGDYLTVGRRNGEEISAPVPGCIAIMDYGDGGITDHIGIVESVGSSMTLLEGNHNNRVERVTRAIHGSTRFWYIMPRYASKPKPQEDDDVSTTTSGVPTKSFGQIFYIGEMGGKQWDVWAKVQNPTDKPITARIVAVTNDVAPPPKVLEVGANKIEQKQIGKDLGCKGNTLVTIEPSVPAVCTFDHRPQ